MKKLFLLILLLFVTTGISIAAPNTWINGHEARSNSVIVSFESKLTVDQMFAHYSKGNFRLITVSTIEGHKLPFSTFKGSTAFSGRDFSHGIIEFPESISLESAITQLKDQQGITAVYPNYIHRPLFVPNDPAYADYQQNLRQIYLESAWDLSTGQGATVAVIDTGYSTEGTSDVPKNILNGYDFADNDSNPRDVYGHGTHVSNTIVERTNNGAGCASVAFNAKLLPCKVFPDWSDEAEEGDIIDAINWAVNQGADVINLSLGGGGSVAQTEQAIANAINNECIVFAASGNDGVGQVSYPAAYDDAVAVGAVNLHSTGGTPIRSSFSNYGAALDLVAPGDQILQESVFNGQPGYYLTSGTSNACPHAAGVAALLISYGGADALAVRYAIESSAINPNGNWTNYLGYGEIDAYSALLEYQGASEDPPIAVAEATPESGEAPLEVELNGEDSYDPSGGGVVSYKWAISGDILSNKSTTSYTFTEAGLFTVTLTVTNENNQFDTDTTVVSVHEGEQDFCQEMLEKILIDCDFAILDSSGNLVTAEDSLPDCRIPGDLLPWECLTNCYSNYDDCIDLQECVLDECDVSFKEDDSDSEDDDDDILDICCG